MCQNLLPHLILVFILFGCASHQKKIKFQQLKKKVCLNLDGKMRIETNGQKYVTNIATSRDKNNYLFGVDVPLFGEYLIELKFNSKGKLLKATGIKQLLTSLNGDINPSVLKQDRQRLINVLSLWQKLHSSLEQKSNRSKKLQILWKEGPKKNELFAIVRKGNYSKKLMIHFFNLDKYFTRQTIYYSPQKSFQTSITSKLKSQSQNGMIVEMFVRECLDNSR